MTHLSLVIATFGRSDDVARCLRSLIAQSDKNFEVLLVDQNPDDRLVPFVEEGLAAGLSIRHLRMDKPSLSGARNLGIEHAKGESIGFPDDDCWYEPDTVAEVRSAFTLNPDLQGVVACWVEQATAQNLVSANDSLLLPSWRNFRGGNASSIALFFRKSIFDQLGGFDERFGVGRWYGAAEETDFVLRALAVGSLIVPCPNAKVHHAYSGITIGDWRKSFRGIRQRARGTGAIYAKHQLSLYVIFRGFTAPIVLPIIKMKGAKALIFGIATVLGRVEGFVKWTWDNFKN